ncbi:IS4 family transposase [Dyella flava]|uniref:IS4 family transposase n=1 Tax=Dyella flava TaxID=1920170 RepID=UPI001EF9AAD5|nr:IS4 family transposase [Dyella flava]
MHALRKQVLLKSVDALVPGRRLTLIDVARSWPDAQRVRAPLKAFDRLLSSRHLQNHREAIYADMSRWLLRGKRPVIVIDWTDLKPDRSWCLLRAAVPIGGRTLPVLDMVFPGKAQGSPQAERRFLQRLKSLIPPSVRPILVTDAGYRTPWFEAVSAMGWEWVGRLRGTTLVKPLDIEDRPGEWGPCRALYELADRKPRELPTMTVNRSRPLICRCVVYRKAPQRRKDWTLQGRVARNKVSRQCARREAEPWLLVASPTLSILSAQQLVQLYARRMQIEASFRDLKSHRYGQGFEDSLTRIGSRLEVLLLVKALAAFSCWIAGMSCEAKGITHWLSPILTARRLYSILRVGREALVRSWPFEPLPLSLQRLRFPPSRVLDHMAVMT